MALSGSTTKAYTPSEAFWTWVEWTATQDITNNTSTITAITYGGSNSYGYYSGTNKWGYTTIAGVTTSVKYTAPWAASTTKKELHRQVRTISHNADGTKSAAISGRWTAGSDPEGSFFDITSSGTFTLDTIPRASIPTLSTSTAALGSAVTISTNRASDTFKHTLKYAIGALSGTIATNVDTSYAWSPPEDIANAIPNAQSGVVVITCETYSGTTLVGTKTVSLTVTVPETSTYLPTVPSPTVAEGATGLTAFTAFIQGKSKFRVQSTATPKYSATISQYKVVIDGGTYYGADITSAIISKPGTVPVELTVTDSRGFAVTVSVNVTVEAYSPPKINSFTAGRSPTDQGVDLSAPVDFSISPIANQNTKRYIVRYRPVGGSWTGVIDSTAYYSRVTTHTAAGVLNGDLSYEVELFVSDYFSSSSKIIDISTAFELINFRSTGKGLAFGKVSEMDAFECALPSEFTEPAEFTAGRRGLSVDDGRTMPGTDGTNTYSPTPATAKDQGIMPIFSMFADGEGFRSGVLAKGWKGPTYAAWMLSGPADTTANDNYYLKSGVGSSWGAKRKIWHDGNSSPIVESGANSNGKYIKFADGTMIAWMAITVTDQAISTAYGSLFQGLRSWTYPVAFYSSPTVICSQFKHGTSASWGGVASASTTVAELRGMDAYTRATGTATIISAVAIGQWKA